MRSLAAHRAVIVSVGFLAALTCMVLYTIHGNGGVFSYPLDDSYIHLAVARTLATNHVWGIGPSNFASASSSPGWTLLLAFLDLTIGSHLLNALILNAIAGVLVIGTLAWGFSLLRPNSTPRFRLLAVALVVAAAPLTNLAFIGMEHVLQTWTILLCVILASMLLAIPQQVPLPSPWQLGLLLSVAAAGAIRYEAVFAVLPILLGLLLRRRFAFALLVCAAAASGPVLFGLFFHHESGFFLPYSVIVKASLNSSPAANPLRRLWILSAGGTFRPVLIAPLLLWLLRRGRRSAWDPTQVALLLSATITLLHLFFAPTRWLMRYESYFVALAFFAVLAAWPHLTLPSLRSTYTHLARTEQLTAALLALTLLAFAPFLVYRILIGGFRAPLAAMDRFDEHVTMGRFVARFFDHDAVVLNDIGAVAFYSHAHILDVMGLGSPEPVQALHAGHRLGSSDLELWAAREHAPVALLQTDWSEVKALVPPSWILVQTWQAPRRVLFGPIQISFYATSRGSLPRLCDALATFPRPATDQLLAAPAVCPSAPR